MPENFVESHRGVERRVFLQRNSPSGRAELRRRAFANIGMHCDLVNSGCNCSRPKTSVLGTRTFLCCGPGLSGHLGRDVILCLPSQSLVPSGASSAPAKGSGWSALVFTESVHARAVPAAVAWDSSAATRLTAHCCLPCVFRATFPP